MKLFAHAHVRGTHGSIVPDDMRVDNDGQGHRLLQREHGVHRQKKGYQHGVEIWSTVSHESHTKTAKRARRVGTQLGHQFGEVEEVP
jgi:hypothetical protein